MNTKSLSTLTREVALKAGLKHVQAADCKWLSLEIKSVTGHTVSETTLKRFFGLAASKYLLSGFSKNILCRYLGYADWNEFTGKRSAHTPEKIEAFWNALQNKAKKISNYTYQALKNRSGIPFDSTVDRHFAEEHVKYFLESNYLATSFIAPGGYGKSILLTRLVEKFWLSENALFKNDIVWFVSGQTLGGLLNLGFDLDTWFMHQVGLVEEENIRQYFSKNGGDEKGRLIMILDGFDEIMQRDDQMQNFFTRILDFITVNQEYKWIKIILSIRSHTWEYIHSEIKSSDFFSKHWYQGENFNETNLINVPLLSQEELMFVLNKLFDKGQINEMENDLLSQLSNPFYIQLLFQLQKIDSSIDRKSETINYFDLVSEFIIKKIYQTRYSSEKVSLIKRFLEHTQGDKRQEYMEKHILVPETDDFRRAYLELLSYGLLVEENTSTNFSYRKTVFFNHLNLLEYFLAMEMLTQHKHVISAEIFNEADRKYKESKYKVPIIKWLIYFSVEDRQIEGIEAIRELHISPVEKEELIVFFAELLKKKFMNENGLIFSEYVKHLPTLPFFFSSFVELGYSSLKYETALLIFSVLAQNQSEKICIKSALVFKAISNLNSAGIKPYLSVLQQLGIADSADFDFDPYTVLNAIVEFYTNGVLTDFLQSNILEYADKITSRPKPYNENPYQRFQYSIVLMILRILEKPSLSLNVISKLFPDSPRSVMKVRKSPLEYFFLGHLSEIFLLENRKTEALRIISFVKFYRDFYPHGHYNPNFWNVYDLLLIKLAIVNGQMDLAARLDLKLRKTAIRDKVLYLAIFSARSLFATYLENDMQIEANILMESLGKEIDTGELLISALLSSASNTIMKK